MPIYSKEIDIVATAYIRADSPEQAMQMLKDGLKDSSLLLEEGYCGDVIINGMDFDDPFLPSLSLSPAMTVQDIVHQSEQDLPELVE